MKRGPVPASRSRYSTSSVIRLLTDVHHECIRLWFRVWALYRNSILTRYDIECDRCVLLLPTGAHVLPAEASGGDRTVGARADRHGASTPPGILAQLAARPAGLGGHSLARRAQCALSAYVQETDPHRLEAWALSPLTLWSLSRLVTVFSRCCGVTCRITGHHCI